MLKILIKFKDDDELIVYRYVVVISKLFFVLNGFGWIICGKIFFIQGLYNRIQDWDQKFSE